MGEVDTVQPLDERGDKMAARLLAIGHDIDARVFLVEQREAHGVALSLLERVAFELPGRPERHGLRQPGGLGETAGNGGRKEKRHRVGPIS